MRLLVHIATGPENSTRLALGLLVVRTALSEARGIGPVDGVQLAPPERLVALIADADRVVGN